MDKSIRTSVVYFQVERKVTSLRSFKNHSLGLWSTNKVITEVSLHCVFSFHSVFVFEYASSENTIILFVCPVKFSISIVFVFSRDHCKSQEKLETMLTQNLGRQTKSIMVYSEVAYSIGHFRVHLRLHFKARLSAKSLL